MSDAPIEVVKIPYEGTVLPGYFLRPAGSPAWNSLAVKVEAGIAVIGDGAQLRLPGADTTSLVFGEASDAVAHEHRIATCARVEL